MESLQDAALAFLPDELGWATVLLQVGPLLAMFLRVLGLLPADIVFPATVKEAAAAYSAALVKPPGAVELFHLVVAAAVVLGGAESQVWILEPERP